MTPDEYVELDATAIGGLVAAGEITREEIHALATTMHERTDAAIHAVVEWYDEPSEAADEGPLVGVPFLFQWVGFCILMFGFVALVWAFTTLWTWTAIDPVPALMQYVVVVVIYPLLAPLLARVRARDPLNVPELSRGTARPGETTS